MTIQDYNFIKVEDMSYKHIIFDEKHQFFRKEITRSKFGDCLTIFYEYILKPNKANFPYHYHLNSEESFLVLDGNGLVITKDGRKEIKNGDFIVFKPGIKGTHKFINNSINSNLKYFEIVKVQYPDKAIYPNANGYGLIYEDTKTNEFYINDERVCYSEIIKYEY